jgi:hypothetical protein
MAPEVLMEGKLSKAGDVYSFGILMAELTRGGKVFMDTPIAALTHLVVFRHQRPGFPEDVPTEFKLLAERCWRPSAANRPSFDEILETLLQLKAGLPDELFIGRVLVKRNNNKTLNTRGTNESKVSRENSIPLALSQFAAEDCGESGMFSLGLPYIMESPAPGHLPPQDAAAGLYQIGKGGDSMTQLQEQGVTSSSLGSYRRS